MCDCESNIYNDDTNTDTIYSCNNIGSGSVIFAGSTVVPPNETFNFKTLKPGTDISITEDVDEITINNTQVATSSVTNLGGGAEMLIDVLAGSVRARTLVGISPIQVNQSGDNVNISSALVSTLSKTVTYNYLQATSVNLALLFSSGTVTLDAFTGASLVGSTLTYTPPNRQTQPVTIPFTITNGSVTQSATISFVPNLPIDYTNTPLLACKNDGTFWKVNVTTSSESLFLNYDGTTLTIADVLTFTVDIEDNLMFYVTNATPTSIRAYNFATKTDQLMVSGISFNIRSMSYNNSLLYLMSSTDGGVIQTIFINPNVKNSVTNYGALTSYTQPFTSVGCTRDSILAHRNGNLYFGIDPSAGNSQILQCLPFGSTTALASNNALASTVTNYYLAEGPNGRVFAYAASNKRFYNSRIMTTWSAGFTSANDYIDIDRYPYIA